jgi:hypothetical protein
MASQMFQDIYVPARTTQKNQVPAEISVQPELTEVTSADFVVDEFPEWSRFELFLHVMILFLSIGIVFLSTTLIWRMYFS